MIDTVLGITGLALAVWVMLVGILALQERRLIFFPTRGHLAKPADYGLRADELRVTASDGTELHGWWIQGSSGRVLVWYHGNAGNIADRLDNARLFVQRLGVDIVLVDYRGYGLSQGKPDERGLYLDGVAIYDTVVARGARPEDIVLFGRSLGGAVAVEVALRRPAGALVLESAFRSVPALAREHYWFVPSALIRTKLDTESRIHRVQLPKLFLYSDRDEIVPLDHGLTLFARAKDPKRFHVIEGAGHNNTYLVGGEPYLAMWEGFLKATRVGP
jgi:fermentation-respiration switch protein FrsA (DUF1100 family)